MIYKEVLESLTSRSVLAPRRILHQSCPPAIKRDLHSYELTIKLNPASAECHFNLASAFNDHDDFPSSMKHYKEA